jgi:uncharacterized protein YodC (DUF2158 family)
MPPETNAPDLQAGDVVKLKSGSPAMTINSIEGQLATLVFWNEGQNTFESWDDVALASLVKPDTK